MINDDFWAKQQYKGINLKFYFISVGTTVDILL